MKKKIIASVFCAALCLAFCACGTTTPTGKENLTATPTGEGNVGTVTKSPMSEALQALPITNYDDLLESTVLPDGYLGLEIDAVTQEEVDAYILEVRNTNKERVLKSADEVVANGDIVIIDYVGTIDGVAFAGGTGYSQELEIGSGQFIDGFEDGLIGAKKGETRVLKLQFPIDYWELEMAGKEVQFEVTVYSIAMQIAPEYNDELVKKITNGTYSTTDEFTGFARGILSEERKYNAVMDYLVTNTNFTKMNDDYLAAALNFEKLYYSNMWGYETVEELEADFGAEESTVLWTMLEKYIRREEQERIILYNVAKENDLVLTEEDFTKRATEYAQESGMTLAQLLEVQDEEALRQSMLMEVALDYLLNHTVEKEQGAQ